MALPAPSWRVKTRPCPFYQQGRCLFAEACNFQHSLDSTISLVPSSRPQSSSPDSIRRPTRRSVSSPQSIRSPPRSPRLAGLLLALKDVIGEDSDDENLAEDESTDVNSTVTTVAPSRDSRLVNTNKRQDFIGSSGSMPLTPIQDNADKSSCNLMPYSPPSTSKQASLDKGPPFDLLSPVSHLAHLNMSSFSQVITEQTEHERIPTSVDTRTSSPRLRTPPCRPTFSVLPSPCMKSSVRLSLSQLGAFEERLTTEISSEKVWSDSNLDLLEESTFLDGPDSTEGSEEYVVQPDDIYNYIEDEGTENEELSPGRPSSTSLVNRPAEYPSDDKRTSAIFSDEGASLFREDSGFFDETGRDGVLATPSTGGSPTTSRNPSEEGIAPLHDEGPTTSYFDIAQEGVELVRSFSSADLSLRARSEDGDGLHSKSASLCTPRSRDDNSPSMNYDSPDIQEGKRFLPRFNKEDDSLFLSPETVPMQDYPPGADPLTRPSTNSLVVNNSRPDPHDSVMDKVDPSPCKFEATRSLSDDDTSTSQFCDSNHSKPIHRLVHSPDRGTNSDDEKDGTSQLAYLDCNPNAVHHSDALTSIYADYSALSGGSTESSDSLHTVPDGALRGNCKGKAESSATDSFTPNYINERVFTKPSGSVRTRSGTIKLCTDSPSSDLSPVSFGALSRERTSTPSSTRSTWNPDNSKPGAQKAESSKRVPFGFRQSFSLARTSHSSLESNYSSKNLKEVLHPLPLSSQSDRALSPEASSHTETFAKGLRPLRLSVLLRSKTPSSAPPAFPVNSSRNSYRASVSFATVSSRNSSSYNPLFSSRRTSTIPEYNENTPSEVHSSPLSSVHLSHLANFEPQSAPLSRPAIWQSHDSEIEVMQSTIPNRPRPTSRFSELSFISDEENGEGNYQYARRPTPDVPHTAPAYRMTSTLRHAMHALTTPKPTLIFAIASDDVKQVRAVLESGEADPNDAIGPQSALKFAITNDQLACKMEIVKTLLAFGADPKSLTASDEGTLSQKGMDEEVSCGNLLQDLDPATRYYVEKADALHTRRTSTLFHQSFFRPLTRVRYELIGQDRALEELFKVLSMHSRQLIVSPIVVLLCGPSGHGKSLLARKFGALLNVPTHTVNMTALSSTQDLWQSFSMSPYETPGTCTLAEFLINNEGKRCVVVLDEIEKSHDEKTLWSLLMPWELGRCTLDANGRPVDVRNVVWLGTSNVGHDLVFEHDKARGRPEETMSKGEYVDLMSLLRPRVSERLGASILSRVTAVLPFVPFTLKERRAICHEALYMIAGELVKTLSAEEVKKMVDDVLMDYVAAEGARSLYRAVSTKLVEII